jgi:hypothetical protein
MQTINTEIILLNKSDLISGSEDKKTSEIGYHDFNSEIREVIKKSNFVVYGNDLIIKNRYFNGGIIK